MYTDPRRRCEPRASSRPEITVVDRRRMRRVVMRHHPEREVRVKHRGQPPSWIYGPPAMKITLLVLLLFASACASDEGTAPTIAALSYSPTTVTQGVATTITGSFTFDDSDGDLAELGVEVTRPDQSKMN